MQQVIPICLWARRGQALQRTIIGRDMAFLLTNPPADRAIVERRREPRQRPSYLRFFSPIPGLIVDLSRQGMAIRTSVEIPIGKEVRFRVRHRSRLFTLNGIVRWVETDSAAGLSARDSPSLVLLGVEFVEELAGEGLVFMTRTGSAVND